MMNVNTCGRYLRSPKFHRAMLVVWILLAVPGFTVWLDSVAWVNFMSFYAILVSHAGAMEAAEAKEQAEP